MGMKKHIVICEDYVIKDGVKYGSYHNAFLDAHQGEYLEDGSYVPYLDITTGAHIIPKEVYDMWD